MPGTRGKPGTSSTPGTSGTSSTRTSGTRTKGTRTRDARAGLVSAQARFAARAASARRRPWRLALVGFAVAVLLAGAAWLVWWSPVLAVRTVTVNGLADPGERQAVAAAAAIPDGSPLARVDTSGAAARVGDIATVDSVSVSRSWPNTVVVSVQRKMPVLAVRNPRGQLQVVDRHGVAYETVATVPHGVAIVNATAAAPDPQGLQAAIGVLTLLPADQRTTVSRVTVSSADLVTFQMANPQAAGKGPETVTVVWGGAGNGAKKLSVLDALLPTAPTVIDVSAPDTPVTR